VAPSQSDSFLHLWRGNAKHFCAAVWIRGSGWDYPFYLASFCSADGRSVRRSMSFGGAGGQRVPPLRRPLRLRSGSRSGRNDRACDWATSNVKGKVKVKVKIKIKIKVKGNGQECPFHTCKSNVNVEGCAAGVRFPTSRKGREKWGIPV